MSAATPTSPDSVAPEQVFEDATGPADPVASAQPAEILLSLEDLPVGGRGVIVSVKDEFAYLYLLRLGLIVGAEVELVRVVSRGTMRIVRVDSGELALRSESARGITVRLEVG
jgi:ferrous iron transport protein A